MLLLIHSDHSLFISAPHTVLQEGNKFKDNEPDLVDHSRIWFIVGVSIECYSIECHMRGEVQNYSFYTKIFKIS